MSFTWAFVGALTCPASALAKIKRTAPARLTSLDDIRKDPTLLRDAIHVKGSLVLRRLIDKSSYAEELTLLRALLSTLARQGARGSGALVSFIDGGPDAAGVAFELAGGAVSETSLTTRKAVKAIVSSPPYRALVARCEEAFASAPKVEGDDDADIRALVLGLLTPIKDTVLLRAARQAKLKIEVFEKGKAVQFVPLLKRHPTAPSLRKALAAGGSEWRYMINAAPLVLLSYIRPELATDFARHLVGRGSARPQLARAVMPILGDSPFKDDFERLWTGFEHERGARVGEEPAEAALIASSYPGVDARVLAALRAEIGTPARWKATYNTQTTEALVSILWRRDHAPGVQLIRAAAKTHPDPSAFDPAPQTRGKRLDRWW
ncbi:MAG: hypothetical protein NT062_02975 [Proteobacteria bacterium]|nr:hypothetical protein [Pseudomonadota bacterium]